MKVALFTDCYDQVNGISNTLGHLVRFCQHHGRKLDLYTHAEQGTSVEELGPVRILRFGFRIPIRYYSDMAFDLLFLRKAIRREAARQAYSLIHLATPGSMGLNGWLLGRSRRTPVVGSYHTALPEFVRPRVEQVLPFRGEGFRQVGELVEKGTWAFQKWFYGRCHLMLAPSQAVQWDLRSRFNCPIRIFSRGVDTEQFHPQFRQPEGPVTVLYVGRLAVEKNLDTLVELMADRKDLRLVLVGDGPYRKHLEKRLPHAVFTGFLRGDALARAYASADLFVFPSTTDTFGNVVLEAMSSGLPAIVTSQMGPKELVAHGENGFISRNTAEFAYYLNTLATSTELRKRMGQAARLFAETRSWTAVFEELFVQYARVEQAAARQIPSDLIGIAPERCNTTELRDVH